MIKVEKDVVTTITLNRPDVANALNLEMISQLKKALANLASEADIRVLVLKAEGKHFCAGADLQWMKDSVKLTEKENEEEAKSLFDLYYALKTFPAPTLALVQGSCYGGGVGFVSTMDYVVATHNTKMALSETRLGLIPSVILPFLASKINSKKDLMHLSLTAKTFTALEAKDFGLVNVCTEDIHSESSYFIKDILSCAPKAQREFKKLYLETELSELKSYREITSKTIARVRAGEEASHGLSCFLEKKSPRWGLN